MIEIQRSAMGIDVSVSYLTDLGSEFYATVHYTKKGFNIPAQQLNAEGINALEEAITLAKILKKHRYLLES